MATTSNAVDTNRYHFNNVGVVRDLIYPNKAILSFKLNNKEEKAILLSKVLTLDGKNVDEAKLLSEYVKANDVIEFDCHIYDKGGVGSGKDKCKYYAMKAWKNSTDYDRMHGSGTNNPSIMSNSSGIPSMAGTSAQKSNQILTSGWVSELNHRKGVITFDNHGKDERVVFFGSKVWFFEKRLGARQPLSDVLNEGDIVQFEAVPHELEDSSTYFCSWFANLVYKGKRPPVEDYNVPNSNAVSASSSFDLLNTSRRGSFGSSESSSADTSDELNFISLTFTNGLVNDGVLKGVGVIGKIVNDKSGVIWWLKSNTHLQSVWFESKHTFLFGTNLAEKNLLEIFNEGDPVTFLAEKPTADFPAKWNAKQVLIADSTASIVTKVIKHNNNEAEESNN